MNILDVLNSDTTEPPTVSMTNQVAQPEKAFSAPVDARPKICLLGADYENTNLGIRALITGALFAIDTKYSNAEVQILDYRSDPREFIFELPSKSARVEMLNIRFSKKLWQKNHIARLIATAQLLKLVPSSLLRRKLVSRNPWLQALMQADYVLSLSYGDSFSDIYGLRRFIYVSLPQVLALLLNRPLVQLPQTIGPFRSRFCMAVAKWILSKSELVYLRDEEAVKAIRDLVPACRAGRVRFCPDLGFVVPPKILTQMDPPLEVVFSHRPVVGFNVSGLLYLGGYTRKNMFGLASDYKALVRKVISYFIEGKGATVLLVPHVVSHPGEGEVDSLACNELFQELKQSYSGRLFTLQSKYDEREVKHLIAQCDFFIGARMHACIAALSQCVPVAAMAYSGKFIGVLRSVGMQTAVVDLRTLPTDEVLASLGSIYDSREALKSVLRKHVPIVQQAVCDLFNDFSSDFKGFCSDANAGR